MKNKCENKTYWFAVGYYEGRVFGERKELESLERWVQRSRAGEKIRDAHTQGFDLGVEDYELKDRPWRNDSALPADHWKNKIKEV